jgi:hypothetical protein
MMQQGRNQANQGVSSSGSPNSPRLKRGFGQGRPAFRGHSLSGLINKISKFSAHAHAHVHQIDRLSALVLVCLLLPAYAQKPSDTLLIRPDTGKAARINDTNARMPVQQLEHDSLKNILMSTDTAQKAGIRPAATPASQPTMDSEDTTYCFWQHPYWGIGAGWGLGSFPLFSEWQNGLPDSSVTIAGRGSAVPKFTVREPVNSYNIFWPLSVSVTPFVNERHALSLEGSFYFLFSGKSFKASLSTGNDSLLSSVEWDQSCAVYFFSLGFDYRRAIPEEYFKVENVKRTTLNIGLSVVPLMRFTKQASYSSSNLPDSTIAILETKKDNRSFNGMGCCWKIGVSSLRKLSAKSGLEIGISYIGRYVGYFRKGSARMVWKDVNPSSGRPMGKVSFLSNTFELSLMLQTGKAAPVK